MNEIRDEIDAAYLAQLDEQALGPITAAGPDEGDTLAEELLSESNDDEAAASAEEPSEQPQGVDPIQLATLLVIGANNRLAQHGHKPQLSQQIALAQAIATVELARWTREQCMLNAQIIQRAQMAQEAAKGPASIIVPQVRV